MTNKEFKKEFKEFKDLITEYPMLSDAYFRLPSIVRFTIFLERKIGIISNESLFRIISTLHYEYNNLAAGLSSVKDEKQRDYAFQSQNVKIWNSICTQVFNSLSMVPVLGDRNDKEYIRMANNGVANLDFFNVYYSLVKYQMNKNKIGDRWNELPVCLKLCLTIINNFDDDFNMEEYIAEYLKDLDVLTKENPIVLEEGHENELDDIKLLYSAVSISKYIYELESE